MQNGVDQQENMQTRRSFTVQWLGMMEPELLESLESFKKSISYRRILTQFTYEDCIKIWQEARNIHIIKKMEVLK